MYHQGERFNLWRKCVIDPESSSRIWLRIFRGKSASKTVDPYDYSELVMWYVICNAVGRHMMHMYITVDKWLVVVGVFIAHSSVTRHETYGFFLHH